MYLECGFRSYGSPVSSQASINEHFEDCPIMLLIIEDLDDILDTMSTARATSKQAGQWVFGSAHVGHQAQVLWLMKKESAASKLHFFAWKDKKHMRQGWI